MERKELKQHIDNTKEFLIVFEDGLSFYYVNVPKFQKFTRQHNTKNFFKQYDTKQKFVTAVWNKIKTKAPIKKIR